MVSDHRNVEQRPLKSYWPARIPEGARSTGYRTPSIMALIRSWNSSSRRRRIERIYSEDPRTQAILAAARSWLDSKRAAPEVLD